MKLPWRNNDDNKKESLEDKIRRYNGLIAEEGYKLFKGSDLKQYRIVRVDHSENQSVGGWYNHIGVVTEETEDKLTMYNIAHPYWHHLHGNRRVRDEEHYYLDEKMEFYKNNIKAVTTKNDGEHFNGERRTNNQ